MSRKNLEHRRSKEVDHRNTTTSGFAAQAPHPFISLGGEIVKGKAFKSIVLVVSIVLVIAGGANASSPEEIPWGGPTELPDYIGAPAKPHPTANSGIPQNPLLAPNPFNAAHRDGWNSDVADVAGPLGRNPAVLSSTLADARDDTDSDVFNCTTQYFDSHGRVITVCFTPTQATVVLADPDTLEVLAHLRLPAPPGDNPYAGAGRQKVLVAMGGIYSYLDARDRLTVVAGGTQIWTLVEGGSEENPVWEVPEGNIIDLSGLVHPAEDGNLAGVMLDEQGRIWLTTSGLEGHNPARVYVLNPATSRYPYTDVKHIDLDPGEMIRNTFALTKVRANRTAAYVVTSQRLYRFDAGPDDQPTKVWWSEPYDTVPDDTNNEQYVNGVKNGQYELGSGTSPTILGEGRYVAITDNAEPMKVVVYRTDETLKKDEDRVVCEVPVFEDQQGSALSNSLIGSRLSLIATNNYDYWYDWESGELRSPSAPGFARIDIDPNGKGCHEVWTNTEVATTTCPRLSTRNGLIYAVARVIDKSQVVYEDLEGLDVYYWTALDFRTGEVVWQKMAGTGVLFDSFYPAGGDIGPNGALYYGGYGGLISMRDTQ